VTQQPWTSILTSTSQWGWAENDLIVSFFAANYEEAVLWPVDNNTKPPKLAKSILVLIHDTIASNELTTL
jgi:hypothetical protein